MNTMNTAVKKKIQVVATIDESAVTPAVVEKTSSPSLFAIKQILDVFGLVKAGADLAFLNRNEARMVSVNVTQGELEFKNVKGNIKEVLIEGRVLNTYSLVSEKLTHKVLIIATTTRTYFQMMPDAKCYGFYVPEVSISLEDAIVNLLANNLTRGSNIFDKTASRLDPHAVFLWEMLLVAIPETRIIPFSLKLGSVDAPVKVPVKLYFDRDDISKAAISVAGTVLDFDFKKYPRGFGALAHKQEKVLATKQANKDTSLSMERAAFIKPKQKTRAEKEEETRAAVAARLLNTPACAPGCLPVQPVEEEPLLDIVKPKKNKPPKKAKKVVEVKETPAKEAKKKKK